MTEDDFWTLIERTRTSNLPRQAATLTDRLNELPPADIEAFATHYAAILDRMFRWDLWGAAFALMDGCSDDMFDYFCDWLISRGRKTVDAVLEDPASLVEADLPHDPTFEELRHVAFRVYEEKTGQPMAYPARQVEEPTGEPFDEDTVYELFPRLAEYELPARKTPSGPTDSKGRPLWSLGQPLFTEENARKFDTLLSELPGRQVTAFGAIHCHVRVGFGKNDAIEARAYSFELGGGNAIHAIEDVLTDGDPESLPADLRLAAAQSKASGRQAADAATSAITPATRSVRIASAERVSPTSVRLTFDGAPGCQGLLLHGGDNGRSGDCKGIRLVTPDETLCLSRFGVEVAIPGFGWSAPRPKTS